MNLFSLIIQPLENASFDSMISGSVAAMMYGVFSPFASLPSTRFTQSRGAAFRNAKQLKS